MPVEQAENIRPFIMRFQEKVEEEDIVPITGRYNDKLQVWEYEEELSSRFPVSSFPKTEKPPTTSTVVTRMGPKQVKTDMGVDD